MLSHQLQAMKQTFLIPSSVICFGMLACFSVLHADETPNFAREVLPILSNKCFVCHGPDGEAKEELRLDSFEAATEELDTGNYAINLDDVEESSLLLRIHDADDPMPPEDAEKQLNDAEREVLTRWVRAGGKYEKHWAFVPPVKVADPQIANVSGADAIDAFVKSQLTSKKIKFADEADRATLARRAALVLTGLPPEPEKLHAFLKDKRDDAYEHFIDTLLADPHFGEHQARYWLDAVRYGDTHGLHLDNRRGIFPYRDWVVHAFNKNLPLDDFITWQLAGDLLPNPTLEQQVATGFVRMNPSTSEGGAIAAEFQAKNNFDRVENLGTVLLGMSLNCARCHSHKYDPIPQTEYYELMAFFNSTAEGPLDGNSYTYGPTVKAPESVDQWKVWNDLQDQRDALLAKAEAKLTDKEKTRWQSALASERLKMLVDQTVDFADLKQEATEIAAAIQRAESGYSSTTLVAKELPKPRQTKLLKRGEYDLPQGDPLQPDVIAIMGEFPEGAPRNRLGLAQWLTSREHPLVSRVLVNRIWQRVYGHGLVRTPEDFGLQGEQPTHPELLDWLAVELQESNWDLKHMLRIMVTSQTFKQSSAWRNGVDDPENRRLARGPSFRLDAEVIRDISLWSSDLLTEDRGGEGIKPYQPAGLWKALMHPASNTKQYVADKGDKLYRRSLYVYWKRTCPHPMLTLFDAPSRESSCVRRSRTNTSLQSLGLFNETQRIEASRRLAGRLLREASNDDERLDLLFTLLASRQPTDTERNACQDLLEFERSRFAQDKGAADSLLSIGEASRDTKLDVVEHAAWTQLAVTVLASDLAILLY